MLTEVIHGRDRAIRLAKIQLLGGDRRVSSRWTYTVLGSFGSK